MVLYPQARLAQRGDGGNLNTKPMARGYIKDTELVVGKHKRMIEQWRLDKEGKPKKKSKRNP